MTKILKRVFSQYDATQLLSLRVCSTHHGCAHAQILSAGSQGRARTAGQWPLSTDNMPYATGVAALLTRRGVADIKLLYFIIEQESVCLPRL